jgi:outer membrane protein assembly factor BamB
MPSKLATRLLAIALVSAAGVGCDSKPPASAAPAQDTATDRDKMEAIGYAGGSEIDDDDDSGVDQALDRTSMQPGYTLFSLHMKAMAKLIDEDGRVVRVWSDPGGRHWDNVELLPNGDLITTGADPTPPGVQGIADEKRYALRLSWDGQVVWKKYMPSHHDIAAAPNDELITLSFNRRRVPQVIEGVDLRDDQITRLRLDGDEIESVSLYDAAIAQSDVYPLQPKKPTNMGGRQWVDAFHTNSVEWMDDPALVDKHEIYQPSNVLFCSRHQDRIAVFDMKTKKFIWAWGADELDGPHDATVLSNGNIMVFDNGLARGWSRVVELDPIERKIVWQYFVAADKRKAEKYADNLSKRTDTADRAFYTKSKGSNQRLANGNTLICNADNGEIFEVAPDGRIVWRYTATDRIDQGGQELRSAFVRAYRYDRAFIDGLIETHKAATPE